MAASSLVNTGVNKSLHLLSAPGPLREQPKPALWASLMGSLPSVGQVKGWKGCTDKCSFWSSPQGERRVWESLFWVSTCVPFCMHLTRRKALREDSELNQNMILGKALDFSERLKGGWVCHSWPSDRPSSINLHSWAFTRALQLCPCPLKIHKHP